MQIEKNIGDDSLELVMPGRIDGEAANQLEIEVIAAMNEGHQSIYVNLGQATFLCSAGIRVLLQYHRKMNSMERKLLVSYPAPEVAAALKLMGFPDLIQK